MNISYIQVIKQLDKFAAAFSGIGTLDELVQSVEEILEDVFAVEHTGLYLFVPSEGRLRLLYAKGFNEEEFLDAEQTAIDRHPGMVYRSKQMIHIPDTLLDNQKLTISSKRSFEIRSRLYLPVMNGEEAVGTFGIVDTKPNAFNDDDIAVLSFISNMAGVLYGKILNQTLLKTANEQILNLSKIPNESPNPILRISHDNILLFANKASYQLLSHHGFKEGETVSNDFLAAISELSASGKPVEREITDGKSIYSFLFAPVEGTTYFNLYGQDITGRKHAENELKKMALIARETGNSIILSDKTGKIEWVNDAFTQLTGYSFEEVKGLAPGDFLQGEETDQNTVALISEALKNEKAIEVDIINYSKSHKKYWIKVQIQPVFDSKGWLENFISIQKEITKEKEIEQVLIKTTTFQKAILNSSAIAIVSTDLNGIIQSFNPSATKMLGYEPEEVIGLMTPHLFHDEMDIRQIAQHSTAQEFRNMQIFKISVGTEPKNIFTETGEFIFVRKDRSKFPVSLTVTALRNELNQVKGFLAMAEDITLRKAQYDALQIANLRFRSLISSMQSGVMVEDEERKVVLVNQQFCDIFSIPVTPDKLVGMDCELAAETSKNLFSDPDSFINDINKSLLVRKIITDHELKMVNGTYLERDFIPIVDPDMRNQGLLWIYRNITQRKNNERDLYRQSEILNGTAMAMNFLLTIPDHDSAIQQALEAIGSATSVDRVYIFENTEDELTGESFFSQRFEWVAEGVLPQIDNQDLQNLPFSEGFPRWYKLLKAGKAVSGLVQNFPEKERHLLEAQDILSLIAVPIFVHNKLWGMVGFDDCTKGIHWSNNESSLLNALAASIGGRISRRNIENELIEARHIAEHATQTKSEFLATMSHEIRTPMNGVIGMTSLLMQTPLTYDQREYTETIKTSGELLLDLINDILDFSKIESGKMVLEEHSFNLRSAIEDVLDLTATSASKKHLGLYFEVDSAIPEKIVGDLTRLRQILVNLVGNAIKFTTKGEVLIRVMQIEKRGNDALLQFSVRDTGIGIPEEKAERLFKPFSQVDASTTRKYGGTGLGLAISAKLVTLMKGNIWVNKEIKNGSEFLFTIKTIYRNDISTVGFSHSGGNQLKGKRILIAESNLINSTILFNLFTGTGMHSTIANSGVDMSELLKKKNHFDLILIDNSIVDEAETILSSELQNKLKNMDIPMILVSHPTISGLEPAIYQNFNSQINKPLKHSQLLALVSNLLSVQNNVTKQPHLDQKPLEKLNERFPLHILVAEDNTINQKMMQSLFEILGYSIQIAANGLEAIETLKRMKIDIIFMDIQMPEMDGLEATRQIIANWGDKRPLIVAMTANALQSDKEKCLATGMDDYISKPLTIGQVITGIEKWALLCHSMNSKL